MAKNFLYNNIRWNFKQREIDRLLCLPTTEKQYVEQLENMARSYYPERRQLNLLDTEFYLNKIALLIPKNNAVKLAKDYFESFWNNYLRLKNVLEKKSNLLPSCGCTIRLERVAEMIAKCTQFAVDDATIEKLAQTACDVLQMTNREERLLLDVVSLYKIKYYCAAVLNAQRGSKRAVTAIAKLLQPSLLKQGFSHNSRYFHGTFGTSQLITVVDCMGNSAAKFDDIATKISAKLFIYANGRNVFDTFVSSKFGNNVAEFESKSKTLNVSMRYFALPTAEIRKVKITNRAKCSRKFTIEVPFVQTDDNSSYFTMNNALCIAVNGQRLFAACAILQNNEIVSSNGEQALYFDITLDANASTELDIATIYSHDAPTLADELTYLSYFGSTVCPYAFDDNSTSLKYSNIDLNPTSHGYTLKQPRKVLSQTLNYSYQMGDPDVATFVDNAGNSATLIDGFVFGVRGESIYGVRGGLIDKINDRNFCLDGNVLRYDKANSVCAIRHEDGKIYEVYHKTPRKTLFYFPLEKQSEIAFADNTFTVCDDTRKYCINFTGTVESYTANVLECNEERLRYKLSGNLDAGSCLAVCLATSDYVKATISSAKHTPNSTPIVRESLLSTYLNYINDKNVFCLRNKIKRPDGLTLAAICYTNPEFVKNYLIDNYKTQQSYCYYNALGQLNCCKDKLAFPLAYVYYRNLIGDGLPREYLDCVNGVVFNEQFEGKEMCLQALILKKAAQLSDGDKVKYLIEYNYIKKKIVNDAKLYAYAQAIGAVPIINPSKARLKDLCNKYSIPKCWYYVSQLENLYGLSISPERLYVYPKVTAENVLEQFALNICGKRIDTTFSKSTVHSMTLNGAQCYQPFCPTQLKNVQNELVVRY